MRNLYLFYLIICVVSCKAKSELASGLAKEVTPVICPENGNCSFEILKNKDLLVQTDHLGSVYTQVVEGVGAVLKFEYKKQEKAGYEDSGYREEIFIALNLDELNIETEKLNEEKLFFARWCYCKGQTGYYKISQGKLKIEKLDDKTIQLHLNFKIQEVPQIITEINHTFSLE